MEFVCICGTTKRHNAMPILSLNKIIKMSYHLKQKILLSSSSTVQLSISYENHIDGHGWLCVRACMCVHRCWDQVLLMVHSGLGCATVNVESRC